MARKPAHVKRQARKPSAAKKLHNPSRTARKIAAPHAPPSVEEAAAVLKIYILERLALLLRRNEIPSYDKWPDFVATSLRGDQTTVLTPRLVSEIVEPEIRHTIATHLGLKTDRMLCGLKSFFENTSGLRGDPPRQMAFKLIADTVSRLRGAT